MVPVHKTVDGKETFLSFGTFKVHKTKSMWERLREAYMSADKMILVIILYTAVCAIIASWNDIGLKGKILAYCIVMLFVVGACFFGAHELWEEDKNE